MSLPLHFNPRHASPPHPSPLLLPSPLLTPSPRHSLGGVLQCAGGGEQEVGPLQASGLQAQDPRTPDPQAQVSWTPASAAEVPCTQGPWPEGCQAPWCSGWPQGRGPRQGPGAQGSWPQDPRHQAPDQGSYPPGLPGHLLPLPDQLPFPLPPSSLPLPPPL